MLETMKTALSSLSVIAANYTPKLLKSALLDMAQRSDENTAQIARMRIELDEANERRDHFAAAIRLVMDHAGDNMGADACNALGNLLEALSPVAING